MIWFNRLSMPANITRALILICGLSGFFYFWIIEFPDPHTASFSVDASVLENTLAKEVTPGKDAPFYREKLASGGKTKEVHAAKGFYSPSDNILHSYWYGGSEEGAGDVSVYMAKYSNNRWFSSRKVIGPGKVQTDTLRFTRKVGNPVAYHWPDGEIWLFFVSVSVGGWGGSSINLISSEDDGHSWSSVRKLITSPFMNISTLVRGSVFEYTDGTIGIPVYHESIGKFGELLHMNRSGRILSKKRLSKGAHSLQPEICILSDEVAVGFLRYSGEAPERVLRIETQDHGQNWSTPEKLSLPNPDSAVASMALSDTEVLLVFNDSPEGRVDLALAYSSDRGITWQRIHYLESASVSMKRHDIQYSYPSMLRGAKGEYHVLYSYNRVSIKHVTFNEAWLQKKIASTPNIRTSMSNEI